MKLKRHERHKKGIREHLYDVFGQHISESFSRQYLYKRQRTRYVDEAEFVLKLGIQSLFKIGKKKA